MKKLEVNKDVCIGCGACVAIDSEHFEFDDMGLSKAISNESLESQNLQAAIDACPTSAIAIIDENAQATPACSEKECANTCSCGEECDCEETCDCGQECHCNEEESCCNACSCDEETEN